MFRIKDTESFIKRAMEVHGDYYDYSKVDYRGSYQKVIIVCPIHGEFIQRAGAHINNPAGCPECWRTVPRTKAGAQRRSSEAILSGLRACSRCGETKSISEFTKHKGCKDGYSSICKTCSCECTDVSRKKRPPLPEEEKKRRNKKAWERHKEIHKEEIEQKKIDREIYLAERRVIARIARVLKSRIREAVKGEWKHGRTQELLGCSIEFFRAYIESLWTEGMSWENHTNRGWHLDHIIPCAFFDLTNEEEQKRCFHYTNYQPLWWKPNISKGSLYNGVRYGRSPFKLK